MPEESLPLRRLGSLTLGVFDRDDPTPGHESLLQVLEFGERLGFDSAWLRHRHLQYGVSSPVAIMASASQRTSRIEIGTAVTPLGWENPLRLAEDLATVDILTGGRVNPGISVGPPMRWDDVRAALYPDTAELEDLTYRPGRALPVVRGGGTGRGHRSDDRLRGLVRPRRTALAGAALTCLVRRRLAALGPMGRENGLHFVSSNVIRAEDSEVFEDIQEAQLELFRSVHPDPASARASQGLVVIPTDSATPEQRARYGAYVEARTPRTAHPQGPQRMLFARDLIGTSDQVAEQLYAHKGSRQVDEVVFALPFTFRHQDYVQILTDIATRLGAALGWSPAS